MSAIHDYYDQQFDIKKKNATHVILNKYGLITMYYILKLHEGQDRVRPMYLTCFGSFDNHSYDKYKEAKIIERLIPIQDAKDSMIIDGIDCDFTGVTKTYSVYRLNESPLVFSFVSDDFKHKARYKLLRDVTQLTEENKKEIADYMYDGNLQNAYTLRDIVYTSPDGCLEIVGTHFAT
tara:strand:+ start:135 stop:668 length:534 start_codon:yes stop_codon:yes gene_type:complete